LKHQLSQQEIDSCFDAANGVRPVTSAGVVPFDFRRLDRIPKSQISSIHFLHEVFVKNLCSSLTLYLRTFVSGSLISVEQMPYADFSEALPTPTCLVYMSMDPYEGYAIMEASPPLIAPILDLVLGGSGKTETELNREITEVEKPLLEGFFQILSHDLRETWKPVAALSLTSHAIETSPQPSGRFVPSEAVVAVAMELHIGERIGMLNLAIPSITLKTMGQRFDQQWTNRRPENPATELAIKRKLARDLQVTLECEYSGDTIAMRDLLSLSADDVLVLPGFDETVDVLVNGIPKFRGGMRVSQKNRRAVALEHRYTALNGMEGAS
jgi:flagellar motor switch protein FliM